MLLQGKVEVISREGSKHYVHALDMNLIRLGQSLALGNMRECAHLSTDPHLHVKLCNAGALVCMACQKCLPYYMQTRLQVKVSASACNI